MKLPLREAGSSSLLAELAEWDGYVSSALLGAESIRACAPYGEPYVDEARSFLLDVALLPIDDAILAQAASVDPADLRSLDAVHLATALSIRDDLGAFVAYDARLLQAAQHHGLPIARPA